MEVINAFIDEICGSELIIKNINIKTGKEVDESAYRTRISRLFKDNVNQINRILTELLSIFESFYTHDTELVVEINNKTIKSNHIVNILEVYKLYLQHNKCICSEEELISNIVEVKTYLTNVRQYNTVFGNNTCSDNTCSDNSLDYNSIFDSDIYPDINGLIKTINTQGIEIPNIEISSPYIMADRFIYKTKNVYKFRKSAVVLIDLLLNYKGFDYNEHLNRLKEYLRLLNDKKDKIIKIINEINELLKNALIVEI